MSARKHVSEAPYGIWAWLFLIVFVAVFVIVVDTWLYKSQHEMMTTEFKEGLANVVVGPILCFVTAGTVAAFIWHMWTSRGGGR